MGKQWDKIFKKYGKVFTKPQEDIPRIVKLFREKGVQRVLDLGCGSGRHAVHFAKYGFEVYGIDIAPIGIKMAKDWLKKDGLKANLKIGSVYKRLPYKDNFFDAVVSIQVIHHAEIKTIRKAIKEIERVLRPGGLIFITVRKRKLPQLRSINKIFKGLSSENIRDKIIGIRTSIPIEGEEKGLIHYLFNKDLLKKEFKDFKNLKIWPASYKKHYSLLGKLKK